MENKEFDANLGLIYEYNPVLVHALKNLENCPQGSPNSLELSQNQNGEYNLVVNGFELHSSTGAVDEAKKIVEGISNLKEENATVVVFGIGLGYLFDEIVQNAAVTGACVILYEPNLDILRFTLSVVDLTEQLARKNVRICSEIEDLKKYIEDFSDKLTKISVSFLTSYFKLCEKEIKDVAQIIEYSHGEAVARNNTLLKLASHSVNTTLFNLPNILGAHFIKEFENTCKNKPALIVSAGPSLAKNIEQIRQNQDKFVIFCVGPALKLLLKNGITPDFGVIIETRNVTGQIKNLDLSGVNLILEPYTNIHIWKTEAKSKTVFFSKHNFLNDYLATTLKINNDGLFAMGTVSYCALSSAKLMGCDPIVLIGQDLAYTDSSCYAKGSAYEGLKCTLNEKTGEFEITLDDKKGDRGGARKAYTEALLGEVVLSRINEDDADKRVENYLKHLNDNLYTVTGQNGEKLPTQTGYAIFIKHFEEFAAQNRAAHDKGKGVCRLINSSIGGAQINGFENISLKEVVKEFQPIDKTLSPRAATNYDKENLDKTLAKCEKEVEDALKISNEMKELIEKFEKELNLRKTITKNAEKLREKLWEKLNYFENHQNPAVYYHQFAATVAILDEIKKTKKITPAAKTNLSELHTKFQTYLERLQKRLKSARL